MTIGHKVAAEVVRDRDADLTLRELLRGWRERALLTQEQLAERAGLNVRTIRRWENCGLHQPRATSVLALADALELNMEEREVLVAAARRRSAFAGHENTDSSPRSATVAVPRQLPADTLVFVGRECELTVLGGLKGTNTVAVVAIDGMPGVGKTALAVHAAHRLAPWFPDGQLFLDLHGHTPGMGPVEPGDALDRMLRALGSDHVPGHIDDRAALYRSILAERRILIVLDNTAREDQVRPLLPGGSSRVIVTSRHRLTGLGDTRTLSLDVLPVEQAVALFAHTVGRDRLTDTPPEILTEIVEQCGLLPLAVRIAVARLRSRPTWSVSHLLHRLNDNNQRLAELRAGLDSVAAALDLSYQRLSNDQRRAYRLLGSHFDNEFVNDAAAALMNMDTASTRRLLDQLLDVHLLKETAPERFRFHDLVRDHASQ